jgi:hypothetical protein
MSESPAAPPSACCRYADWSPSSARTRLLAGWLLALAFSSSATLFFPGPFRHVIDSFTQPARWTAGSG